MRTFTLVCALLFLLCGAAAAQTLELDENLQMQDQGIVDVAPTQQQGKLDPFDRDVHIGLRYGMASRDIYGDGDTQDFNVIGLSAYGYGKYWGVGIGFSYFMEEEMSESNFFIASDKLTSATSMMAVDLIASVRFPVYFLDIFINTGLTVAKVSAEKNYAVNGSSLDLENINESAAGIFIEFGGRLYLTRNINVNISAHYSYLEVETGEFPDEETIDMGGASIYIGLGYAFY